MLIEMTERGSFSGHETFPFRYTWLPKAVEHVQKDPHIFNADDAMVRLGVGKNMVKAMRYWGLVTGVLEEIPDERGTLRPTDLGLRLFDEENGWDPYFEDPATPWLLHWQLASTPEKTTTWFWTFNHLPQPEFSKEDMVRWLWTLVQEKGWPRTSQGSLRRDVDCFIRTYVPVKPTRKTSIEDSLESPLVELGLIREFGRGSYILHRGDQQELPDAVLAYALAVYLQRSDNTGSTIPLDTVSFGPGAPGRVFCLSEDSLLSRLDHLREVTGGAMRYDDTGGMKQIFVTKGALPDPMDILARHYEQYQAAPLLAVGGA